MTAPQKTIESPDGLAGQSLGAAPGSAFIRECDTCKMVTAIDLDPTPEHWKEMCYYGQTIRTVPHDEAMRLWKTSGRCKCTPNNEMRDHRFHQT
jgi:hypothetical protein